MSPVLSVGLVVFAQGVRSSWMLISPVVGLSTASLLTGRWAFAENVCCCKSLGYILGYMSSWSTRFKDSSFHDVCSHQMLKYSAIHPRTEQSTPKIIGFSYCCFRPLVTREMRKVFNFWMSLTVQFLFCMVLVNGHAQAAAMYHLVENTYATSPW